MKNKWIQWDIQLKREDNCIIVILNEYTQDPERTKWPTSTVVGREKMIIYPWVTEYSIKSKIVKVQGKLLRKYERYEKFWNKIKDIPLEYGGKRIIEDSRTLKFLDRYRMQNED